jgi:hypothetical protein
VVFGGGGGSLDWWISDQVPGGLVKQFAKSSSDDSHGAAVLQLEAYGTGAVSELGSM